MTDVSLTAERIQTDGSTVTIETAEQAAGALRHTATSSFELTVPMDVDNIEDIRLGDATLTVNGATWVDGKVTDVEKHVRPGYARVRIEGPGWQLRHDGPGSPITYQDRLAENAMADYLSQRGLDGTVYSAPVEVKKDDSETRSSDFTGLESFASGSSTEPILVDASEITVQKITYAKDYVDFDGIHTVEVDDGSGTDYYISGFYAYFEQGGYGGGNVDATISPEYDIPADRVGIRLHGRIYGSGASLSESSLTFNGEQLDDLVSFSGPNPVSGDLSWTTAYTGGDDYTGGDLQAGNQYTVSLSLLSNSSNTTGYEVDAVAVYDTKYAPLTWDEPTEQNGTIAGPEWYPVVDLPLSNDSQTWNLAEARIESTANDVSNEFAIDATNNGTDTLTKSNTATPTFDFKSQGYWGRVFSPTLTFGGYDDGSGGEIKPTVQNAAQSITDISYFATTDTSRVIADLELPNSDFENLQDLCRRTGYRFTVDPRESPPTVELYVSDDATVAKAQDWEYTETPTEGYHTRGYANEVTVVGPNGSSTTRRDQDEINRLNGEVITAPPIYDDEAATQDARVVRARTELLERTAADQAEGAARATAAFTLPGYPYDVPWGRSPLERVRLSLAGDVPTMDLEFSQRQDPTQTLIDARTDIRDIKQQ